MKTTIRGILADFGGNWKSLFLTDLLYKGLAVILLTPLLTVLFRILITLSGSPVLADTDIARFFLGPPGWICLILSGAVLLAIQALELAALMANLAGSRKHPVGTMSALQFATRHTWPVLQVTGRMTGWVLLVLAPFLIAAALTWQVLLSAYDINFYLQETPPEFLIAAGIGLVLLAGLAVILVRLAAGWLYALPLVLFERTPPRQALAESSRRTAGHRQRLVLGIVVWLLAMSLVSGLVTGGVVGLGRLVVPGTADSLTWLTLVSGGLLVLWALANLAVNLLSTTGLATMLFGFYRNEGAGQAAIDKASPGGIRGGGASLFPVTRTRLLVGLLFGLLVAGLTGLLVVQSIELQDRAEVIAHRGASAAAPENTMAAIRLAIAEGADRVEIDVQENADGEVVVFHDSDFMKLAGNPLKIWNATGEDLAGIDIGSWFDPEFAGQQVPTLAQVLAECKGRIGVVIELKYYGHDADLENRVARIVEDLGMQDDIVLMSLKAEAVRKMKALRPDWQVGLLLSVAAGDIARIDADFLAVNAEFVTRSLVHSVHRNNRTIMVWTVNDPVTMSTMMGMGVDGLITDQPALARQVREARADMTIGQRLVLQLAEMFGVEREIAVQ